MIYDIIKRQSQRWFDMASTLHYHFQNYSFNLYVLVEQGCGYTMVQLFSVQRIDPLNIRAVDSQLRDLMWSPTVSSQCNGILASFKCSDKFSFVYISFSLVVFCLRIYHLGPSLSNPEHRSLPSLYLRGLTIHFILSQTSCFLSLSKLIFLDKGKRSLKKWQNLYAENSPSQH